MTTITVHGFKGGTGKSLIALTLAYQLSNQGEKVLTIDGDFHAPCFETFFPRTNDVKPFTEYLTSDCSIEDVITETTYKNLWTSYAPTPSFGQEVLQADVKAHGQYLKRIRDGIKVAHEELGFDKVIIDNASGISLMSINYLTCSDKSVMVIRPVRYGVETTYELVSAIYRKLRYANPKAAREDFHVWNQVPLNDEAKITSRIEKYLKYWQEKFIEAELAYGSTIPYIPEIVAGMIVDNPLDLQKLTGFIQEYIEEISTKLG
jgi:MinD-like ATPase involved in chromosome partitioning or flagellar assembly